jgi:hypothetical protein
MISISLPFLLSRTEYEPEHEDDFGGRPYPAPDGLIPSTRS